MGEPWAERDCGQWFLSPSTPWASVLATRELGE